MCVCGHHSLDGGERRHLRECIRQRGDRLWVLSVVGEVVVRKTAAQGTHKASKRETGGYPVCAHACAMCEGAYSLDLTEVRHLCKRIGQLCTGLRAQTVARNTAIQ